MTKERKSNHQLQTTEKDIKKRFRYKFRKYFKKTVHKNAKPGPSKNLTNKSTKIEKQIEKKSECKNNSVDNTEKVVPNLFKKIENEYMEQFLNIYYEKYSNSSFVDSLKSLNQNKKIMTENILNKFGITEEIRKCTLNYFGLFIESNNISFKYYFLSVSLFDSFLINYSEMNSDEKCSSLFLSKKAKIFSEIKLTLLLFCCYYLIAKYYNVHILSINDLLECRNAKDEFTYNDLDTLIRYIIIYTDCNIDNLNVYTFVEIYMFEIKRIFKKWDCKNYENFLEIFKDGVNFLGAKISKKIFFSNIDESIQALGIMIFGFHLCKQKFKVNDGIDFYMRKVLFNLKEVLNKYYGSNKLAIIINWLSTNWYK